MHLPTHALVSWLVAEPAPLSRRQRALVLAAGLFPDLDALTLLGGVEAYQRGRPAALPAFRRVAILRVCRATPRQSSWSATQSCCAR